MSAASQAATFSFSFTAPIVQFDTLGDTYQGYGQLFADAQGGGVFRVTGASGTTIIQGFGEYSWGINGGEGTVALGSDGLTTDGLVLFGDDGSGFYSFSLNAGDGRYRAQIGEVSAPQAVLTITSGVAAVPEPASWAMIILGTSVTGIAMRRRERRAAGVRFA